MEPTAKDRPAWALLGRFYARRSLRILPLYYLVIVVGAMLDLPKVREMLPSLLTYTLNFRIARQDYFDEYFAHFWSLSVEEQFYIVWPWIVLWSPRRLFSWVAAILPLIAIGFRTHYILSDFTSTTGLGTYVLPWAALDSLGVGVLLSVASRHLEPRRISRLLWVGCALAVPLLLVLWLNPTLGWPRFILDDSLTSIVFAGTIWAAASSRSRPVQVLRSKPLVYLGKISYGLYVYHPFVFVLTRWMGWWTKPGLAAFVISSGLTLVTATISWYAFEAPLNALKRHFRDPEVRKERGTALRDATQGN